MDVEAGVPGGLLELEVALVLRSRRPGRVGRWRGHHHEERPLKLALQELHRHVGLRKERLGINTRHLQTLPPRGRMCNCDHSGSVSLEAHQQVGEVVLAVVGTVFVSLAFHGQRVVVISGVLLLQNTQQQFLIVKGLIRALLFIFNITIIIFNPRLSKKILHRFRTF